MNIDKELALDEKRILAVMHIIGTLSIHMVDSDNHEGYGALVREALQTLGVTELEILEAGARLLAR